LKARLIRFAFALHRWSGVVLGLLMFMWCLSGIVMIWQPEFPSVTLGSRDYRTEGLAPIALPEKVALPEVPADASISSARIEMMGSRAAISLAWDGGRGVFDLATGQKIEKIGEAEALDIAGAYVSRHRITGEPSIKNLSERDEFTVSGYFNSGRPYWQVRLNDSEKTMLYISSVTGDVRQRTTESLRWVSWFGAIPHWLYFTELRKDGPLWTQVIIWTSLAGCFLTVLGLFVGIRQFRRRHSTGKLSSPYRGAKLWHHMLGLVFGVLVLTWTFSGFASMNPWGWLESGPAVGEAFDRMTGKPVTWSAVRPAIETQTAALRVGEGDVVQLSLAQLEGQVFFVRRHSDGSRERVGADGSPAPFDEAARKRAADLLAGKPNAAQVELLNTEDDYYYRGSAASDFPIVRIIVPEADDTRFYLDPVSGELRFAADPGARGFRWLHLGLHRVDFFGWLRVRPLWDIVIVALMLGVTGVCGLGAYMGIRKLARGGKLDNQPTD